ncbi:hypothetical protein [Streptomyces cinerochromogenes]|uniref:hypothetical protein n=1 Tax=Streptomyces cinerochromogenes TaxID=66422 RepID=UPI00166FB356|nr:hypothetical protein [Streptomyces cinerochromogenes]GGS78882.1 hypothetical protein GCM10010206_46670 [Streptomyces cinerochromogenes]
MIMRFTAKARRGMVALTVAAGLAVVVSGCGGGGNDDKKPETSATASRTDGSQPTAQEGQSEEPLAELKGQDGLLLQITAAQRDSGGFITVNGNLKNEGAQSVVIPSALRGDETEIVQHGTSLGGATLVDAKGKKRYYVLRDTDGRPLTTTGLTTIQPGQTIPVFMQFPSPPTNTTEVILQLPTFSSAGIQISG